LCWFKQISAEPSGRLRLCAGAQIGYNLVVGSSKGLMKHCNPEQPSAQAQIVNNLKKGQRTQRQI
jgi:hypothetical protein